MNNVQTYPQPSDLVAVSVAQRLLGVSHAKMSQLVKSGVIRHFPNPLDRRVKLASRAEVLALKPTRIDKMDEAA